MIDFFQGDFFERSKENISVVPSIDLFSLEYPEKEEDILTWGNENKGFFLVLVLLLLHGTLLSMTTIYFVLKHIVMLYLIII